MGKTAAVVVAAGRGQRFGGDLPKQYAPLAGQCVLRHSIAALQRHPKVDRVLAVIHRDDEALYHQAVAGLALDPPVFGGDSRQESVLAGLEALAQAETLAAETLAAETLATETLATEPPERVLIHDGARPFLPTVIVDRIIAAINPHQGAIAALPMTDTVKRVDSNLIETTLDRAGLWRAQTPQGFPFSVILAAHRAAKGKHLTDDAAVAEAYGLAVQVVEGSAENFKVTTMDDLARAERWLAGRMETRTGQGFDVHRFAPGDAVTLLGVVIPHDQALSGHSDADVGLHALTDAILGALGAGDIGQHFPPSEERWRGTDSSLFLSHACALAAQRGARISHVDITLICERPKIGPHRPAMVQRLSELLALDSEQVSVKATTTEGLGFTGRGEGIAAQAIATLLLPSAG